MHQISREEDEFVEEGEENYSEDEFEELGGAEEEKRIEYKIPCLDPLAMFSRMNVKSRRMKMGMKKKSDVPLRGIQSDGGGRELAPVSARTKPRKGSIKSWIATPIPIAGNRKTTVSSISLQLHKPKSTSTTSLVRKRIGSSQPYKKVSSIQQRLNSAKEIQIKDLMSRIRVLENRINDLTAENRTLNTGYQRQAVALQKYEGAESDFPRVLSYHQNEVKYLQQALRKAQSTCRKFESGLRTLNNKIVALEDHNAKLQKLVESDELGERQKLQHQVLELSQQLELANERLEDHGRQFELLEKNHSRQLAGTNGKLRESNRRVFDAEQELYRLTELIRQKDRVISYLRMRSREPGLEPPLHRKVMEEYNSSYKYYYQVEQSFESVNQEFYYPHSNSNSISPSQTSYASLNYSRPRSRSRRGDSTGQMRSTASTRHEEPHQYEHSSGKSNATSFSEELARRSRERNLDVAASESDYEEDREPVIPEENEIEEVGVAEVLEHVTVPLGLEGSGTGGSGKTYVVLRKSNGEENDGFQTQLEEFNCQDSTAYDDVFEQSGAYSALSFLQTASHGTSRNMSMDSIITDSSQCGSALKIKSRIPVWIKRGNAVCVQDSHLPYRVYDNGDGLHTSTYFNHNCQETETGGTSRDDTEAMEGAGDGIIMNANDAANVGSEYYSTPDCAKGDEDTETSEEVTEEEEVKYSDEEFYSENDPREEMVEIPEDEEETKSSCCDRRSQSGNSSTPAPPHTNYRHTLDGKFFTFTSKPTYLGEKAETVVISDDNRSVVISKHDSILKYFSPLNSAQSQEDPRPPYLNNDNSRKTTARSKQSTASNNSLASLHKKRPKGRGRRSCDESTPAFKTRNRPEVVSEGNDSSWTFSEARKTQRSPSPQEGKKQIRIPMPKKIEVGPAGGRAKKQTSNKLAFRNKEAFDLKF